jgi:DNA invertase Pin-like site-specific DNA recombinase
MILYDAAPEIFPPATSEKIGASHLQRLAVVYVRQSTTQQVLEHGESTRLQYGLADRARTLGWPEERILIIDDDLGKSASSAEGREGFARLVAEVGLDHVGIILGIEMSRLARSSKDWHQLLEICALFGTLICDLDGVYDPASYNDRLLLGLKGTMSEAELHILKQRLHQGKVNKARRGELTFPVPIGYVRRPSGEVVFDPDEEVQQVVHLIFKKFEELTTLNAVLRYLVRNGVKLGVRIHEREGKGELEWRRPGRTTLQSMLKNPIYAGAYAYGRRRVDPRKKKPGRPGTGIVTRPTPSKEWHVLLKDRLPAYISWERYEENVKRLAENRARSDAMGAPRVGASLLQGLLICGRCGHRMSVRYGERGRHLYLCNRLKTNYGGTECQYVAGPPLDEFVGEKVLEALEPASLDLSLEAAKHVEEEREELDRLWQKRMERAVYEAERAGRHYRLLEPENRLVARQLAKDWEEKLAAQQRLEEDYHRFRSERPKLLTESEREAIRRLSEDIPALWGARTTTNKDRKEIVRQVIERIAIDVEGESERVGVEIRWAGGLAMKDIMIRPVNKLEQLSYYPELCERVRGLAAQGLSRQKIAERVNEEGYRPPKRWEKFGRYGIGDLMHRLGVMAGKDTRTERQNALLNKDEWWLPRLAQELGMPRVTLHDWTRRGWVKARQQPEPQRRWIVWADEEELKRLRGLRALPNGYHVRKKLWIE